MSGRGRSLKVNINDCSVQSGMMIESMAGKSAALHGICHDATPFTFSEKTPAVEYFGEHLIKGN